MESNDKVVLAITGTAATLNVACNLYVDIYPASGGALVGVAWVSAGALVLAVGGLIWRGKLLTGQIEAMEVTAGRYVPTLSSPSLFQRAVRFLAPT